MSDISVLALEHQTTSAFALSVNDALIVLKKATLRLAGCESLSPDVMRDSATNLKRVLDAVLTLLTDSGDSPEAEVPGAVITELQTKHRGNMRYYLDDVQSIISRLVDPDIPLLPEDLDLLDELAALADDVATQVFRHLMRM